MLRRNKFIAHAARFFFCDIHYTLEAGCDEDLRRAGVVRVKICLGRNLQGIVEPASDVGSGGLPQVQNSRNHPIRPLQPADQPDLGVTSMTAVYCSPSVISQSYFVLNCSTTGAGASSRSSRRAKPSMISGCEPSSSASATRSFPRKLRIFTLSGAVQMKIRPSNVT